MRYLLILIMLFCFNAFGATYYITVDGAGTKAGGSWANAMGYAEFEARVESTGDKLYDYYYVQAGTYTLTSDLAGNGNIYYAKFIGVKSATTAEPPTSSDLAYGTDRPVFACGEYYFNPGKGNANSIWGFVFTGTRDEIVNGAFKGFYNCKFTNSSETANRRCVISLHTQLVYCEVISTAGFGISGSDLQVNKSSFHSSDRGISASERTSVANSFFYNNTTYGYYIQYTQGINTNNTFYNNGVGHHSTSLSPKIFTDLIFLDNTTALTIGTGNSQATIATNLVYYDNTSDGSAPHYSINKFTSDPDLTDEANGNFLPRNKNLVANAFPSNLWSTPNYNIAGAAQFDASASGGGEHTYISVN